MIPNQQIRDDLFRYEGRFSWFLFLRYFLFTPGFRYSCIWRWTQSACKLTKPFWILLLRHYQVKYAIQIPHQTRIGRGFKIGHWGHIVINPAAIIGHNFNIAQGALVGNAPPSSRNNFQGGVPTIGNNVCIGANAIVIGKITIGDNCVIAPGAFVNQDMPANTIAIGNPASFHNKENASDSLIVFKLTVK